MANMNDGLVCCHSCSLLRGTQPSYSNLEKRPRGGVLCHIPSVQLRDGPWLPWGCLGPAGRAPDLSGGWLSPHVIVMLRHLSHRDMGPCSISKPRPEALARERTQTPSGEWNAGPSLHPCCPAMPRAPAASAAPHSHTCHRCGMLGKDRNRLRATGIPGILSRGFHSHSSCLQTWLLLLWGREPSMAECGWGADRPFSCSPWVPTVDAKRWLEGQERRSDTPTGSSCVSDRETVDSSYQSYKWKMFPGEHVLCKTIA